jgi:HPt (histidine-containing phosphotransfer) domain-containing protein
VLRLLGNKKILVMNYGALSSIRLSFVDFTTKALCILPLPVNGLLKGYIIMQGTKSESFVHDDTTLLFIGDTLAYLLNFRANWEKEISDAGAFPASLTVQEERAVNQNEGADDFLEKVKTIADLDISKGLLLIGGGKEEYSELLRVTIHAIGESIEKMHRLYEETPGEFGIAVHGMKGALYSIGAENLGEEAQKLEFAAKSGDTAYCSSHYLEFEEKLKTLSRNLSSLFPREERNLKTGDPAELEKVLEKILEACNVFDSSGAQTFLSRTRVFKWEDDRIREELRGIEGEIENIEYKGAAEKIEALLQYLRKDRE